MVDKQIKELNNNIKAFEYSFQNENEIKNEIYNHYEYTDIM